MSIDLDMKQFFISRLERQRPGGMAQEYKELEQEAIHHYESLKEHLDEEWAKNSLKILSDAYTNMESLNEFATYQFGFHDGVKFIMKALEGVGGISK